MAFSTKHGAGCGCSDCVERIPEVIRFYPNSLKISGSSVLSDINEERKAVPLSSGCVDYFPAALAAIAHLSWAGNQKHNPGEPLHDARSKSNDDGDCLMRHFVDRGKWDVITTADGRQIRVRHSAAVAWRALRILQKEEEADGAPLAPAARA